MPKRLTVVVSQGQSNNPAKRKLEEDIVAALLFEPGVEVTIVPHLYDLKSDGPGMMGLQAITTDFVVLSWLYERATRWTLDRNNIRGQAGTSLLVHESDDDEDDLLDEPEEEDKLRVIDNRPVPKRMIFCVDLRVSNQVQDYVDEVKRIHGELSTQVVQLDGLGAAPSPTPEQLARVANPTNDTALKEGGELERPVEIIEPIRLEENASRRWYPVIDYGRCTNCMECIDFCLFGVYGVDGAETILVEMPDNCRKGCPACSRVCPENAIIFPQHKTPTIAGSDEVAGGGLKIDLSQLFGKPKEDEKSLDTAVRERDEQLLLAGRDAVGTAVGVPKRQTDNEDREKDELDNLIDAVDDLDI